MTGKIRESRIFIISDTHWNHKNIIDFCERPFDSVEEMNESLILRWNACVTPEDTVIHLGDVGFHYQSLFNIIPRLNGTKLLIRGNHDWNVERMQRVGFRCLTTFKNEVRKEPMCGRMFVMAHRPRDLPTWDGDKITTWSSKNVVLCGHEHNNAPTFIKWVRDKGDIARPIMALNMSCEYTNFSPVPIERVIETYDKCLQPHLDKYLKQNKRARD